MEILKIRIAAHDDSSPVENRIKIKPQNRKKPANDPYDIEEDDEWEEDDTFIAGMFIF